MSPAANTLLSLVLIALGIVAVILSFLVPDRKKSLISLGLAGLIILVGVVQFAAQSINDYRWRRRLSDLRGQNQVDMDKLREEFKKRAAEAAPAPADKKK